MTADARFELSGDIWIEKLDREFAIFIQRAWEPASHNVCNDVYERHLYASMREAPLNEATRDEGVIAPSRLSPYLV